MCGVVAAVGQNIDKDLIKEIFNQSKIRGLHAFGFAGVERSGRMFVVKDTDLKKLLSRLDQYDPIALIGHTRYSTSGDWQEPENNQPLIFEGKIMVFNGTIDMRSKGDIEKDLNKQIPAENDGFILIDRVDDIQFRKKSDISFAAAWIEENTLKVCKNNNRPLRFTNKNNTTYIASTVDILIRSGVDVINIHEFEPIKIHEFPII